MTQPSSDRFSPELTLDEELVPFDVRDRSGRRAMFLLIGAFVSLLFIAFIIFKVYQAGVRDRAAPPVITADNTPYKVAPQNPGGTQTPNQDKAIYDAIRGTQTDTAVTPAPAPEEPLDVPDRHVQLPDTANIVLTPSTPAQNTPPASKPLPSTTTPPANAEPAPARIETPPTTRPQTSTASGSDFVVQVASVRTEAAAESLWQDISRKFSRDIGQRLYSDIRRADLGDKGIYYRLRVAGLTDREAASALCNAFKAGGQACFVTRK